MPEIPEADHFEVLRRKDGSYTLIPSIWRTQPTRFGKGSSTFYELERAGQDMGWGKSLDYVATLIKEYRPDFDYAASEENAKFLLRTIKRLNEIENSVDALRKHLEYWQPDRKSDKAYAPMKDPEGDVRAAILGDVMSLGSLEIKELLEVPRKWKKPQGPSTSQGQKREDATMREASKRGRVPNA